MSASRRYEILLPLRFNDGRPVPEELFSAALFKRASVPGCAALWLLLLLAPLARAAAPPPRSVWTPIGPGNDGPTESSARGPEHYGTEIRESPEQKAQRPLCFTGASLTTNVNDTKNLISLSFP